MSAQLDRTGLSELLPEAVAGFRSGTSGVDAALDKVANCFGDLWLVEANIATYAEAVADVMIARIREGARFAAGGSPVKRRSEPDRCTLPCS